ncbi:ATP-binding protein, partial [Vibrio sp.]|nr:ATP-binding protein [Vibrio sp.]
VLNDKQTRQVDQILHSGKHLLNLINEVLDLAKIESGRFQVSLESIELGDLVSRCIQTLAPIAQQYGVHLHNHICTDIYAIGDYTRVQQVLINLISNGIKYNRSNGSVTVRVEKEGQYAKIVVSDTGVGLSIEQQSQLFQPFNRLGAEMSAIEGTGVGLALTKKLMSLMNGEIGVSSIEGEGSDFWFRLPVDYKVTSSDISSQPESAELSSHSSASKIAKKVLYIEDNPTNQRLMEDIFNDVDMCELVCVASGETGVELAFSDTPDLILLDIDLPGMNGFQVQTILKNNPLTRDIPVVALSANASHKDVEQAKNSGFLDYVTKPIEMKSFINLLDSVLSEE